MDPGGDFNMIILLDDKKGGLRRLNRDAEAFRIFIEEARLIDLETGNGIHTWNNRRGEKGKFMRVSTGSLFRIGL